eukprot:4963956-Pyramimonas_sp.AAC.1
MVIGNLDALESLDKACLSVAEGQTRRYGRATAREDLRQRGLHGDLVCGVRQSTPSRRCC